MKFMIPILPLLLMSILFGAPSHARENNFPIDNCDSLFKGVKFLVGEADKNWTALGKKSEGSPVYNEHAKKIQWSVEVAANYTTIYEAFCTKAE